MLAATLGSVLVFGQAGDTFHRRKESVGAEPFTRGLADEQRAPMFTESAELIVLDPEHTIRWG